MKTLNLIPALLVAGLFFGCSKSSTTAVKPTTPATTNSLIADSVSIYAGVMKVNPIVTDGPKATAIFSGPIGMTMDAAGNLYVAEYYGDDIRKITPGGMVSTISTGMDMPDFMAFDASGNLYVTFNQIDKVSSTGSRSMVSNANFIGLTADNTGNIFAATQTQIMKMDQSSGKMMAYAGTAASGSADGTIATATFTNIEALTADKNGDLFLLDGNSVRKVTTSTGKVQTLTLNVAQPFASPGSLAVDQWDNIYVANYGNNANGFILKITADGTVSNFAGNGKTAVNTAGLKGQAQAVSFNGPLGIMLLASGNLLVSSYGNVIQEIHTHKQQ